MKNRTYPLLAVTFFSCLMATICFAQDVPVSNAAKNPNAEVKTIFSFKTEIGLTDDQEDKLKAVLYDEQNLINVNNDKLKSLGAELNKMIDNREDMQVIRKKLEDIAKVQVEGNYINIEYSRKADTILTPDQMEKWRAIQKKFASSKA